jgi:uncharacterized membrane protein YhfC
MPSAARGQSWAAFHVKRRRRGPGQQAGTAGAKGNPMLAILIRALNAGLMVALPLLLGWLIARKHLGTWRIFGLGALTFVASQILHFPFNSWLLTPLLVRLGWSQPTRGIPLFGTAVLLGLSAGIFEETARALGYRYLLVGKRSWGTGLMYGAGHGGAEAILLGLVAAYALAQALVLRNADLTAVIPAAQVATVRAQLAAYWSAPWSYSLLGAVERLCALAVQVSLAVLVLQAFRRRNGWWVAAAIGWHALVDASAVAVFAIHGAYVTEGVLAAEAAASLAFIFRLRSPEAQTPPASPPMDVRHVPLSDMPPEPTGEQLDNSRYSQ